MSSQPSVRGGRTTGSSLLSFAPEPARNNYFSELAPGFACGLHLGLLDCRAVGINLGLFEGARTQERQQWLWEQGRTRPGEIVTKVRDARTGWHFFRLASDLALRVNHDWSWDLSDAQLSKVHEIFLRYGIAFPIKWDTLHCQPGNLKVTPSAQASKLWDQSPETLWRFVGWDTPRFLDRLEAL